MISREQFDFGQGSFVGKAMQQPDFFELPTEEQARIAGWVDGCPVVEELIDPANTSPGRGPENMLNRYASVNFWFSYISREVKEHNPDLYDQLMTPLSRELDEPVGKHESESVPSGYVDELYPMNTLAGFGIPRIFVEQLGEGEKSDVTDRMTRGLQIVETAIKDSNSPLELLAKIGEGLVVSGDVSPEQVLKHTMSVGWVEEHNASSTIELFKSVLADTAPTIWNAYSDLDKNQKTNLKLV